MKTLVELSSEQFCVADPNSLFTASRFREIVDARKVCMFILRKYTLASLDQIGGYFNRDHATALHSIRATKVHYKNEKLFRERVDKIMDEVRSGNIELPFTIVSFDRGVEYNIYEECYCNLQAS